MRIGRGLVAAVAVVAAVMVPVGTAGADAGRPVVVLSRTAAAPGETVNVRAVGLPPDLNVKVELCGARGVDGDVDCVSGTSAAVRAWGGEISQDIPVSLPPKPCPCVVRLTGVTSSFLLDLPIEVIGAPVAPVVSQSPFANQAPTLTVVSATVTSQDSFWVLFGAPAPRTLVVTVRNDGASAVNRPVIEAAWGRSDDTRNVISTPVIPRIDPGEQTTYELPFQLDPVSFGDYEVHGGIGVVANRATFSASTSTWPWLLFAAALIVFQTVVVGMRNLLRRRVERARARDEAAAATPGTEVGSGAGSAVASGAVEAGAARTVATATIADDAAHETSGAGGARPVKRMSAKERRAKVRRAKQRRAKQRRAKKRQAQQRRAARRSTRRRAPEGITLPGSGEASEKPAVQDGAVGVEAADEGSASVSGSRPSS